MDYEKRYKEALETARKINSGEGVAGPEGWSTLEVIFPELKESEDERIRKAIIEALKQLDREKCPVDTYPYLDWAAWLEKQGKQSPVEELKQEQKAQIINKACKWLKENIYNRVYKCNDSLGFPTATFIGEFKKAMEDEQ